MAAMDTIPKKICNISITQYDTMPQGTEKDTVRRYKKLFHDDISLLGCDVTVPPKSWCLPASPHSITSQKTNIDIFTAVRTSNFIQSLHIHTLNRLFFIFCNTVKWIKIILRKY
jgi:hypothetical protein